MVADCFLPKDNFETFLFCYGKLGRHHNDAFGSSDCQQNVAQSSEASFRLVALRKK